MVVTTAIEAEHERRGLRPLDPTRDLGKIADLIEEAFSDELDARSRAVLRDMRWMARLSPWLGWLAQADPAFGEGFDGFVWEEPTPTGRRPHIVGNASLNRAPGDRRRWILCNVAVRAEYRRAGIARQLTQAAIEEAQESGADGLVLQVFQANTAAMRLYTSMGFREVGGETDLRLDDIGKLTLCDAPGYSVRAWRHRDGRHAYELARLASPSEQQWMAPVRADDYGLSWWHRLGWRVGDLAQGRRVVRLVAWNEDRLVAVLKVTEARRMGGHRLQLLVHPEHVGRVEAALVGGALYMLQEAQSRAVWATVNRANAAGLDVLRSYGFEEKRTLLTMSKDLR